jgi:hypothetical protein
MTVDARAAERLARLASRRRIILLARRIARPFSATCVAARRARRRISSTAGTGSSKEKSRRARGRKDVDEGVAKDETRRACRERGIRTIGAQVGNLPLQVPRQVATMHSRSIPDR